MNRPKGPRYVNLTRLHPLNTQKPWVTRVMVVGVSSRRHFQNISNETDDFRSIDIVDKSGNQALLLVYGKHVLNHYDDVLKPGNVLLLQNLYITEPNWNFNKNLNCFVELKYGMKDYGLSDGETPLSPEIILENEEESLKLKEALPSEWQSIVELDPQYNQDMPSFFNYAQWFLSFVDFYEYLHMLTRPPKTIEFLCYPYLKGIYPKGTELGNDKRMMYYKACTNCHRKLITCPNDVEYNCEYCMRYNFTEHTLRLCADLHLVDYFSHIFATAYDDVVFGLHKPLLQEEFRSKMTLAQHNAYVENLSHDTLEKSVGITQEYGVSMGPRIAAGISYNTQDKKFTVLWTSYNIAKENHMWLLKERLKPFLHTLTTTNTVAAEIPSVSVERLTQSPSASSTSKRPRDFSQLLSLPLKYEPVLTQTNPSVFPLPPNDDDDEQQLPKRQKTLALVDYDDDFTSYQDPSASQSSTSSTTPLNPKETVVGGGTTTSLQVHHQSQGDSSQAKPRFRTVSELLRSLGEHDDTMLFTPDNLQHYRALLESSQSSDSPEMPGNSIFFFVNFFSLNATAFFFLP